jgi:hypothetical protein
MSATNGQRYIVLSQKIKNMEASANKYGEKAMAIGGRLINLSLNQESKINLKELADLLDDGIGVLDAAVTFEQADGEFHQEIALAKQAAQEQQAAVKALAERKKRVAEVVAEARRAGVLPPAKPFSPSGVMTVTSPDRAAPKQPAAQFSHADPVHCPGKVHHLLIEEGHHLPYPVLLRPDVEQGGDNGKPIHDEWYFNTDEERTVHCYPLKSPTTAIDVPIPGSVKKCVQEDKDFSCK